MSTPRASRASNPARCCAMASGSPPSSSTRSIARARRCSRCCCAPWPSARVSAFNREYRFPHMTVYADRNRIEKEETFELASAARDRFMFELRMGTPTDAAIRRALVFDPGFHDVDELLERVSPGILAVAGAESASRAAIQRSVETSEDARALRDGPVGRQPVAAEVRRAHRRRGHGEADSGRRQSARHDGADARGASRRLARRPQLM